MNAMARRRKKEKGIDEMYDIQFFYFASLRLRGFALNDCFHWERNMTHSRITRRTALKGVGASRLARPR
jgi:hypothetical protein